MAEAQNNVEKIKRAKHGLTYQFKSLQVKQSMNTDKFENEAQKLLASGRRNRQAGGKPAVPAKDGGGANSGLSFKEKGTIADITPLLDRPKVMARAGFANWCASFKPAEASATGETDLIPPTKMNAQINENLKLVFDKELNTYLNCEDDAALLKVFVQVVVGLMEKFYQQTQPEIRLEHKRAQLILSCKMINSSEEGYKPANFAQDSDNTIISTNYVVSVGESPTLRIVYQDIGDIGKPDIVHDIQQDKLTLWHNDRFTHRIEAKGKGEAILLSIGLVSFEDVPVFDD